MPAGLTELIFTLTFLSKEENTYTLSKSNPLLYEFISLTSIIPANQALSAIAFSSMFLSLFLIINRKGALSQIIGILSFENSIVAFAVFSGLEQSPTLQMGIIFDIFIWLIIATVFISMLYKHFGSLDVTSMTSLKE